MPIQPINEILPKTIDDPDLRRLLNEFADAIEETAHFGTHIMKWVCDRPAGGNKDIPSILQFRHVLELLDSISVLVRESSIDPCKLLLRAILEAFLNAEYIFQDDTTRRAMSFMVCHEHDELTYYKKLDPSSTQGKRLRQALEQDRLAKDMDTSAPPELQEHIDECKKCLSQSAYSEAEAEYSKRRRPPSHWYSLFGGPSHLRDLAERVSLPGMYEILYRLWSGSTHATDIIKGKILRNPEGKVAIVQIRRATDAQTTTFYALALAIEMYRSFIQHYLPNREDNFTDWYTREIRHLYLRLVGEPIMNIV